MDRLSRYRLVSRILHCIQYSCQIYHLFTYRMLIHHHDILHSIASNQETHYAAHEVQQQMHAHGIQRSCYAPHHPERASPQINGMAFRRLSYNAT